MSAHAVNFRVHLHLGAHKTATTFMQNWLAEHSELLQIHGIAYIPLDKLRQQFTPCFWEFVYGETPWSAAAAAQLRAIIVENITDSGFDLASTRLLILSEENLLGSLHTLANKGLLYPDLATRMNRLAEVFAGCTVQAFLAVRDYREFYPSAYAETLRRGTITPFADYINGLDLAANSWLAVVDAIEAAFGTVTLWTYEAFQNNAAYAAVLSALLQLPIAADSLTNAPVIRRSLTQKGLELVMHCQEKLSVTELNRLVNLLSARKLFDEPDTRISLADDALNQQLESQYQHELVVLASRFLPSI